MIITDDNFSTIVAAVEEGRGIYGNIRKTLQYLLAGNTGELLLMTIAVVAGFPLFLRTMFLTGFLTAGVSFAVFVYVLETETTEVARTYAFTVLVFAEMLRAFGARSEIRPVWQISLFTNVNLVIAVVISFGLQVWSQHNATLGSFLKTSAMSLPDCFLLLAVGAFPLVVLEIVKVVRRARQDKIEPILPT